MLQYRRGLEPTGRHTQEHVHEHVHEATQTGASRVRAKPSGLTSILAFAKPTCERDVNEAYSGYVTFTLPIWRRAGARCHDLVAAIGFAHLDTHITNTQCYTDSVV